MNYINIGGSDVLLAIWVTWGAIYMEHKKYRAEICLTGLAMLSFKYGIKNYCSVFTTGIVPTVILLGFRYSDAGSCSKISPFYFVFGMTVSAQLP